MVCQKITGENDNNNWLGFNVVILWDSYVFSYGSVHYCINYVVSIGGLEVVSKERKWSKVQARMGLPCGRSLGTLLKSHYERILFPFDVFQQGKALGDVVSIYHNVMLDIIVLWTRLPFDNKLSNLIYW